MRAVIVANGDVEPADAERLHQADLVIAADGGALACERFGVVPHVVIGDMDSLGAAVERFDPSTVVRLPTDKDESDSEVALARAWSAGADAVVVLGALGGPRLDHALANLLLLADPSWRERDLCLIAGGTTVRALHAGATWAGHGAAGSTVTLLPIAGDAEGVVTTGLHWPLRDETLYAGRSRGLSNVVDHPPATVTLRAGILLVLELALGLETT